MKTFKEHISENYVITRKVGEIKKYWNGKKKRWVKDDGDLIDATGYKSKTVAINNARKLSKDGIYVDLKVEKL